MSSETRPIKVTNLDSEKIRAKEIAKENSKTGKVTAVVEVMYLSKDKICNLVKLQNSRSLQLLKVWSLFLKPRSGYYPLE